MDDLVTVSGRVVVASTSPSLPTILTAAHGTGHEGVQKTLHRLRADFHVSGARTLVQDFVQCNNGEQLHPAGLLQPLPVPSSVWSDVVMDFIEGFPKVNGKSVVLTVVDRFSKFAHFIPLGHLGPPVHSHHGCPRLLRRDCAPTWNTKLHCK